MTAPVVEVRPAPGEYAVVHAAPGTTIRLRRPGAADREFPAVHDDPGVPVVAAFPLPEMDGFLICTYLGLAGIRNGHHARDRAIWHQAAKLIGPYGVAYVAHKRLDYYGRPTWIATGLRPEPPVPWPGMVTVRLRDPSLPHQIVIARQGTGQRMSVSCNCLRIPGLPGVAAHTPIEVRNVWETADALAVWRGWHATNGGGAART